MIFRVYASLAYYFTVLMFGVFGLALSALGLALAWLPAGPRVDRWFQRLIHRHFRLFLWWGRFSRIMPVTASGFPSRPPGARVLVANHPSLVDAPCVLAHVPEALCIFKPAIRRNPVLGAAARRAGYLASDGGPDLVRQAADALAAGNTLLLFPEGTRTPLGGSVQPLKPGFVLMARRARVPIQLVRIETDSNVLVKERPWWKPPHMPARFHLTWGPVVSADNGLSPTELAERIRDWFRLPAPACHDALAGLILADAPASSE